MSKSLWQSRLFWLGVTEVCVAVGTGIGEWLQGDLSNVTPLFHMFTGISTIILRIRTNQAVG